MAKEGREMESDEIDERDRRRREGLEGRRRNSRRGKEGKGWEKNITKRKGREQEKIGEERKGSEGKVDKVIKGKGKDQIGKEGNDRK